MNPLSVVREEPAEAVPVALVLPGAPGTDAPPSWARAIRARAESAAYDLRAVITQPRDGYDPAEVVAALWSAMLRFATGESVPQKGQMAALKYCLSQLVGLPLARVRRVVQSADVVDAMALVLARAGLPPDVIERLASETLTAALGDREALDVLEAQWAETPDPPTPGVEGMDSVMSTDGAASGGRPAPKMERSVPAFQPNPDPSPSQPSPSHADSFQEATDFPHGKPEPPGDPPHPPAADGTIHPRPPASDGTIRVSVPPDGQDAQREDASRPSAAHVSHAAEPDDEWRPFE